ncbi:hypothetical protein GUJ93_ZPchr0013g37291 [Zizania palustris]|uniref:Uncharacterized protein n=1 Tax=Zizania palustris TaxID=103762 RepID=A0A8J5WWL3_ZIZPA|nr:hypothetical protein GUJ93_ZPchr0013g37291 [Zizania palustris]
MAANGEGGGDPAAAAAARRRWDLTNKGAESIPMVKEAVEMSTDEESDDVVICPPDGNNDDLEVISSSDHDGCQEGQATFVKDPNIDDRSKCTVPQPFALSTQRKSHGGGNSNVAHPSSNGEYSADKNKSSPASLTKKIAPLLPRRLHRILKRRIHAL